MIYACSRDLDNALNNMMYVLVSSEAIRNWDSEGSFQLNISILMQVVDKEISFYSCTNFCIKMQYEEFFGINLHYAVSCPRTGVDFSISLFTNLIIKCLPYFH